MFKQGLLVLAASLFLQIAWAEDYDPVQHARAALIATIAELNVPTGSPTTEGTRRHAAGMMAIKNALSLYRDGELTANELATARKFLSSHLDYVSAAKAGSRDWSIEMRLLVRKMYKHALIAKQLIDMDRSSPAFDGLMRSYHNGGGYDGYRLAEEMGIEQVWLEAE